MIFGYLALSYILSLVGFLGYKFFVSKIASPGQRKIFIYVVLLASLILPYPLLQSSSNTISLHFLNGSSHNLATADPISDVTITACYEKALSEKDFCKCEELQFSNIGVLSEVPFINKFLHSRAILSGFILLLIICIISVLLLRVGYLIHLVLTSEKEAMVLSGKKFILLRHPTKHFAASFRLFKKYIIWKPSLDKMDLDSRNAVLYHELAHLKNWDTWQQILLSALKIFWFLNPVFYKLKKELLLVAEYLADEFAVRNTGDPRTYASILIRLKEDHQNGLFQQFGGDDLKLRILNIIEPRKSHNTMFYSIVFSSLFLMTSMGVLAAPIIKEEVFTVKEYELLITKKESTGKNYFCKNCILEELEQYCIPE